MIKDKQSDLIAAFEAEPNRSVAAAAAAAAAAVASVCTQLTLVDVGGESQILSCFHTTLMARHRTIQL